MKSIYSFFSVLTVVALIVMPFTYTTAPAYAQEATETPVAPEILLSVEETEEDAPTITVCDPDTEVLNDENVCVPQENTPQILECDLGEVLNDAGDACVKKPVNEEEQDLPDVSAAFSVQAIELSDPVIGSIEICKIIVDNTGDQPVIIDGSDLNTTFSINLQGPGSFDETALFDTPLDLNENIVNDNGSDNDAECKTYEFTQTGEFTYPEEIIDDTDGNTWGPATYHDYYNATPGSLDDFFPYTNDGQSGDIDTSDGVMNLGNNNTRKLVVVNTLLERVEKPATIIATKIVCNDESDLPNWGGGASNIDENTATDFLATHSDVCRLEEGWDFQWAPKDTVIDYTTQSNTGDLGTPWTMFDQPTDVNGQTSMSISPEKDGDSVWVHEVWNDDYIEFTGQNTNQDVSAELYCNTDVLNYDNFERVDGIMVGGTYYCVAFNVPVETQEVFSCQDNLIENGDFEIPEVTDPAEWDVFEQSASGLGWLLSWVQQPTQPDVFPTLELQRGVYNWVSNTGAQHAELGSDWDGPGGVDNSGNPSAVKISQVINTTPGRDYDLSFAFSARPNTPESQNVLGISWGGVSEPVISKAGTSDVNWETHNKTFIATTTQTTISFSDLGTNDSVGTLLDSVCLQEQEVEEPEEPTQPTGEITFPEFDEQVLDTGTTTLMATYDDGDDDNDDAVQWAVRIGTCQAGTNTVAGNVDGFDDSFQWNGAEFSADVNLPEGDYCFVFNPTDDAGENDVRETRLFTIESKDENNEEDNENNNTGSNASGGFFGSFSSGGSVLGDSTEGLVLGESCGIFLNEYLHVNSPNNNRMEIVKLQAFLKTFISPDLEVTGIFDQATFDAVSAFQLAYAGEIIGPWADAGLLGRTQSTGYVYKTTKREINLLMCPALAIPVPQNLVPDNDVTDNI